MDLLIVQRPADLGRGDLGRTRGKFTIEPLEPGFGYTLGNSLRRTLLSSIPGAAITQVKIDGVLHEFSTIEGVTEDVTDIVLNLKELVIRSENEEPTTVHLRVTGPAEVTAGDIQLPAGVEILNPDHHIATLNKKATLSMELRVEQGRGYVAAATAAEGGDRHDPDRRPVLAGQAGHLRGRADPCRADDELRPPDPRCRDERRDRSGRGTVVRPGPRSSSCSSCSPGSARGPAVSCSAPSRARTRARASWRSRSRTWTSRCVRTTA